MFFMHFRPYLPLLHCLERFWAGSGQGVFYQRSQTMRRKKGWAHLRNFSWVVVKGLLGQAEA
jgi:hypothetical protein